jgi:hypothetical protein
MYDENEEPMTPRDEIEYPIYESEEDLMYESERPRKKKRKILAVEVNLLRTLKGLSQDAEDGRFPLFHNTVLIRQTKASRSEKVLQLAKEWISALEEERLNQNVGAIYWTKFLEAFPNLVEMKISEEIEDWTARIGERRS